MIIVTVIMLIIIKTEERWCEIFKFFIQNQRYEFF